MADFFDALTDDHIDFIGRQHIFFVGTGAADGRINVSPKGMDSFRVLGPNDAVWLNLTGSGNETAAHVLESPRMTVMFCSFDRQPLILRLYGEARLVYPRDAQFDNYHAMFGEQPGTRQFFELHIDSVQTSCGYAVPFYELKGERPTLRKWTARKGEDGIRDYWATKNAVSIDGKPTAITDDQGSPAARSITKPS